MVRFFFSMLRLFRMYPGSAIIIGIILLVELTFEAFLPLSIKFMIDYAIIPQDMNVLYLLVAIIVSGSLITSLLGVYRDKLYANVSAMIIKRFYERIFAKIQRLPLQYFKKNSSGELLARYNTDLSAVETMVIPFPQLILASLNLVVNIVILFVLQWQLASFALLGFLLSLVIPNYLSARAFSASKEHKAIQAHLNSAAQENIQGQETIKAFGIQGRMKAMFRDETSLYHKRAERANFLNFLLDRTTSIGTLVVIIITICVGSLFAFHDMITIGSLTAFTTILLTMSFLISDITWLAPQFVQAKAGMERIDQLFREPESAVYGEEATTPLSRDIRFDQVYFSYDGTSYQLKNIRASIPTERYTSFVGGSGSGKSTMLNLLMRFYPPDSGDIYWDDTAFSNLDDQSFRSEVSVVSQDTFLFNRSIKENIRLGKLDATDDEIVKAAKDAGIHDTIIALTDGYDSLAGEQGKRLSGGQRQRVAIARAILKNPSLLILDEATSALDPSSEQEVLAMIRELSKDRTVISVTHRLTTSIATDCIFVLDEGKIVETGTHQDLLNTDGPYKKLYEKQSGFSFSEDGEEAFVTGNRLKAIPLLEVVDEDFLDDLAHFFITETYIKGRKIIQEGEEGDKFYLIVRGKAAVTKETEGKVLELATLSDGDFFGEIALLKNVPRTATITAKTPLVLLSMQRKLFQHLLTRAPHLREQLEKRL